MSDELREPNARAEAMAAWRVLVEWYGVDQWRRGNAGKEPQEFDEWRRELEQQRQSERSAWAQNEVQP